MGDPGNKARKDMDRAKYPHRDHGEEINDQRSRPKEEAPHRPGDKNWSAAGTRGTAHEAPKMPEYDEIKENQEDREE